MTPRRPVELQAIARVACVDIGEVMPVIEAFRRGDRCFLMPPEGRQLTADTLIDISHESLIRQWRRMKEWVEQEAKSAETYRRLEQTALLHEEKCAGLLQGLDLYSVLEWKKREKPASAWAVRYGGAFDRAMRFLAASERRHKLMSILIFFRGNRLYHCSLHDLALVPGRNRAQQSRQRAFAGAGTTGAESNRIGIPA